jgi:hypothetical protein
LLAGADRGVDALQCESLEREGESKDFALKRTFPRSGSRTPGRENSHILIRS